MMKPAGSDCGLPPSLCQYCLHSDENRNLMQGVHRQALMQAMCPEDTE